MTQLRDNLVALVNDCLDNAEAIWRKNGASMQVNESEFLDSEGLVEKSESVSSNIPGFPLVHSSTNEVAKFIALVADMRGSSEHLLCAISEKNAKVTSLQRVYYETSALLPALALTIRHHKGAVTEYLGDGVLALFKVENEQQPIDTISAALGAARSSINICREVVNEALKGRYNLPPIDIGVGLAYSNALVTLVGLEGEMQPKAFGECVFRATKLSTGVNKIYIDSRLNTIWPTTNSGNGLKFKKKSFDKFDGYEILSNN